jgi:hypothetical protein
MRHSDGASFRQAPIEELGRHSLPRVPRRLDFVRFRVADDEIEVGFMVALELAVRTARAPDDEARTAAAQIRAAGASRPISDDGWEVDAATVRRLRGRLPLVGLDPQHSDEQ